MSDVLQDKENSFLATSPKSPYVLKPKPLLLKRKPKRLEINAPLGSLDTNVLQTSDRSIGFSSRSPTKCINPFKCSVNKRKQEPEETDNNVGSFQSQKIGAKVAKTDSNEHGKTYSKTDLRVLDEDAHLGLNAHFSSDCDASQVSFCRKQKSLPVDWSLKTKIRLISSKPFPWRTSFKTSEEASGTTGFVRCLYSDKQKNCNLDSSHGAKFYQQCLVWMHPSLPWMSLYPRDVIQPVTSSPSSLLDARYLEVLHSSWCDSLRSLYQLVRTCQCPYFYICAPTFTVMFRSGGVGSVIDIHAAIAPTTRGLRNALTKEGIEFTMPLNNGSEQCILEPDEMSLDCNESSTLRSENDELNKDGDPANAGNISSEEEEPGMWLESLGLSQQDFPSLSLKKRRRHEKNVDHHPESLVYVEGPETQALVNFLLNYPSCMSKIGPMAGIPPTLLSPVAFLGATLQSHKVRHAKIQKKDQQEYAVELSGPLLPNVIHSLCSLLSSTQDGNFSAILTPCQSTLAFAKLSHNSSFPSVFAIENLKDCGLSSSFIQDMCTKSNSSNGKGIATITAENGLYSWT